MSTAASFQSVRVLAIPLDAPATGASGGNRPPQHGVANRLGEEQELRLGLRAADRFSDRGCG
jgi:hypothetical protein